MELKWRGKSYEFTPRLYKFKKENPRTDWLNKNIYGFDTETISKDRKTEIQCIQISSPEGDDLFYLDSDVDPLREFLENIIENYFEEEYKNKYIYMYGFNLLFDWGQLIKKHPQLIEIAQLGTGINEDLHIYTLENKEIYLKKGGLFEGSSPFFSIKIHESKRRNLEIMFRDGFSFFKGSLKNVGRQLGLGEKLDRQKDLGLKDYREVSEGDPEKKYFEEYALLDAQITRKIGESIKELHESAGLKKIRISPPSFAMGYLYNNIECSGIWSGVPHAPTMQLILDTYKGGRTGGIIHGEVFNMWVADFVSSYPYAMTELPSFGDDMEYVYMEESELENTTQEELMEVLEKYHCFLRVDGIETDTKYPSLIVPIKGKLTPVCGTFENIPTTGAELCVGIKSKTLTVSKIHELVILMDSSKERPFRDVIIENFERKQKAEKESIMYQTAKVILNSLYGKLIESRTEKHLSNEIANFCVPYPEGQETEFANIYFEEYLKIIDKKEGIPDINIEEEFIKVIKTVYANFEDLEESPLKELSLSKLVYGSNVVPAAASLITGIARARLNALQKVSKADYWDTDSVFKENLNLDKLKEDLLKFNFLPSYIKRLQFGESLGDLDIELKNGKGYLAGVKRYYLENDSGKVKKAIHGVPNAKKDEWKEIIEKLATGQNAKYRGKEKPISIKQCKTVDEIGLFEGNDFESGFYLDPRLTWVKRKNKWIGKVKTITEQKGATENEKN